MSDGGASHSLSSTRTGRMKRDLAFLLVNHVADHSNDHPVEEVPSEYDCQAAALYLSEYSSHTAATASTFTETKALVKTLLWAARPVLMSMQTLCSSSLFPTAYAEDEDDENDPSSTHASAGFFAVTHFIRVHW